MQQEKFRTTSRHGYSVRYSPFNPTRLACSTAQNYGLQGNGTLFILESVHGEPIRLVKTFEWPDGLYDVTWSEIQDHVVVLAGADGNIIFLDLVGHNAPRLVLKGHTKEVSNIEWNQTRQEQLLATASWDQLIKVWDPQTGSLLHTYEGHTNKVYCATWSPHIPRLLASTSGDGTLRLWNLPEPVPVATIPAHPCEVLSCDWSKYSQSIIATSGIDGLIRGWDIRNIKRPAFELRGHNYAIRRIKFSPHNDSVLASVSYDFTTRIWDWKKSPEALMVLQNHKEFVFGLDFNLHVRGQIADCSWDQSVCISHLPANYF
ncbi:peroxisomal targeting signal 2 receptor-like [Ornithodoros turicata]|uniref:peroxisomal targeting signal 2 receptor-like n=1 Tax=Ornithodoros turicata TaxID=34597 RepID=UPI00313A3315